MGTRGRARLAMGQGVSVWVLEAPQGFGDAAFHAHHALQLTICFEGQLTLVGSGGPISGEFLAVAPDTPHQLQAHGLIAVLFVEPESPGGRILGRRLLGEQSLAAFEDPRFRLALSPLRHACDETLSQADMLTSARAAVATLTGIEPAERADPRIEAVLRYLAEHLEGPLGLDRAAREAGVHLSSSRLRHLFVEQTGLAFKTYLLWLRLVRAVQVYSEGHSLTRAAHAAGFADSAHFSRVFRRTFGAPASTLTRL